MLNHAANSATPPKKILVVRLGAIGDVVRTLPALRLLRETWPDAEIRWAVETAAAPLLEHHPDLDAVEIFDRKGVTEAARRWRLGAAGTVSRYLRQLREFAPDMAIDFQGSFKSGLLTYLSGAKRRYGFGRRDTREESQIFVNHRAVLPPEDVHRVRRAAFLARFAGARDAELRAEIALTREEMDEGERQRRILAGGRPTIALAPFTSARQAWKRYPLEKWARCARLWLSSGRHVIVLAGPAEEEEARRLKEMAGGSVGITERSSLRQLAGLLAACDLFVGGDTGPMHMAWAVGTACVVVYGPTDARLNAPFGEGHEVLAPARPTRRNDEDKFPGISPEEIVERAETIIARQSDVI